MATTDVLTADDLLAMGKDAPYEVIRGELREVSPTSAESSFFGLSIGSLILQFVAPRRLGLVTGSDGGYVLFDHPLTIVAPDVGFVRRSRIPSDFTFDHYLPVPPDSAVEVASPSDRRADVVGKAALYLEAGVPLVWVAWPMRQVVDVFRPDRPVQELGVGAVLDGEEILPGFRLPVADIFLTGSYR